jgi:hypothetical protein
MNLLLKYDGNLNRHQTQPKIAVRRLTNRTADKIEKEI